ncbi:MAG TPA: alcohol dehydrogenase catalytic domain-containing protein [Solirubrobacterales bacterium]|jgi:alcohol dehydrogenase|nr:alcohol dehydrogenase catalytic domain-containing protein [Solirubrobacterales bacterium]
MRQLTFVEAGVVEWREVEAPELADPRAALVRPLAVARCDLDLPMAAAGIFPGPFGVGHETVAEVVEVGADVTAVAPGRRVLVPFQVSCGGCVACRDRRFGACHDFRAPVGGAFGFGEAGGGHGGGMSDLLLVPAADHLLVPAPDGVDPEVLCTLVDNVCDGYRTVAGPLAEYPGAEVLVVGGAGSSVGLYAVAAARALGSERVRYVDSDAAKCEAAERLGAAVTMHEGPWPRSFERALVTIENTMDPDGLACALRSTDDYGFCTSVAIHFGETTPVPLLSMYTKGITLHASRADSRRLLPEVIKLVAAGRLDPSAVPTTVAAWDDAAEAWLEPAVKLVVAR